MFDLLGGWFNHFVENLPFITFVMLLGVIRHMSKLDDEIIDLKNELVDVRRDPATRYDLNDFE